MAFNRSGALDRAIEVVKAGLQSGSIKLQGSHPTEGNNTNYLKQDSAYINGLINSIADNLGAKGDRE